MIFNKNEISLKIQEIMRIPCDFRNTTRVQVPMSNQPEPGPLQSNSFRVLQRITGTDADEVDGEQLRKLQLTEEDKYLMNKFKEQGKSN